MKKKQLKERIKELELENNDLRLKLSIKEKTKERYEKIIDYFIKNNSVECAITLL